MINCPECKHLVNTRCLTIQLNDACFNGYSKTARTGEVVIDCPKCNYTDVLYMPEVNDIERSIT